MQGIERWIERLEKFGPCGGAVEWARTQPDPQALWDNCERGDWLLWLMGRLAGGPRSKSRKQLVLAACECARLALPYVKGGELRPLRAIETAEAWAKGKAELKDVRAAAYAAAAAGAAAYTAVAGAAAYAAAVAGAAAYAADATDAAAAAAARSEVLKECADIARKYHPKAPRLL